MDHNRQVHILPRAQNGGDTGGGGADGVGGAGVEAKVIKREEGGVFRSAERQQQRLSEQTESATMRDVQKLFQQMEVGSYGQQQQLQQQQQDAGQHFCEHGVQQQQQQHQELYANHGQCWFSSEAADF